MGTNLIKKGDVFIYCIDDINRIILPDKNNMTLLDTKINADLLQNRYLVFTYLGKGLVREYYSSKILNFYDDISLEHNNVILSKKFDDFNDFYINYKDALRNPLIIHLENNNIYELNKTNKEKLNENIGKERKIADLINELNIRSRNKLRIQMDDIKEKNYGDISTENLVYNLKKRH